LGNRGRRQRRAAKITILAIKPPTWQNFTFNMGSLRRLALLVRPVHTGWWKGGIAMITALAANPGSPRKSAEKLLCIQYLRALAALMVVFHHALHQFPGFLSVMPTEAGQAGVDLFFVISGFVMVFVTAEKDRTPLEFMTMRIVRIVPTYWFYTLGAGALLFVLPALFNSNELSVRHLVLSLFFIPHTIAADPGSLDPIVKLGWTLNYEMFFYVLFALAMAFSRQYRVALATGALALFVAVPHFILGTDWTTFMSHHAVVKFYTSEKILEFGMGMIIGDAFARGYIDGIQEWAAGLLIVGGILLMFTGNPYASGIRAIAYGIPAASIVIGALALERAGVVGRWSALLLVGDASYSIYLVHIFPIAVLRTLWRHEHLATSGLLWLIVFALASAASAITLGAISYFAIEKPSLRYLRGVMRSQKRLTPAVSSVDS
jgi:exopolysaccharide production protein ExoZ